MARTKASVGAKVASGKSSKARCVVAAAPVTSVASGSDRGSKNYSGGNPVCPRETPKWQKPITNFFIGKSTSPKQCGEETNGDAGTSKSKRNIIESDEESPEKPKNKELDDTLELEPLTGDNSHKLEEYYPKNGFKGKGVGKKTKLAVHVDINCNNSLKRDREEEFEEESESKKVRVE